MHFPQKTFQDIFCGMLSGEYNTLQAVYLLPKPKEGLNNIFPSGESSPDGRR